MKVINNISVKKKGKINLLLFILKLKVIFQEKEYLINNLFIEDNYLFGNEERKRK